MIFGFLVLLTSFIKFQAYSTVFFTISLGMFFYGYLNLLVPISRKDAVILMLSNFIEKYENSENNKLERSNALKYFVDHYYMIDTLIDNRKSWNPGMRKIESSLNDNFKNRLIPAINNNKISKEVIYELINIFIDDDISDISRFNSELESIYELSTEHKAIKGMFNITFLVNIIDSNPYGRQIASSFLGFILIPIGVYILSLIMSFDLRSIIKAQPIEFIVGCIMLSFTLYQTIKKK